MQNTTAPTVIRVSTLPEGHHDLTFTCKPESLGDRDLQSTDIVGDIVVRVTANKDDATGIRMVIEVAAQSMRPCDRCLELVSVPLHATTHLVCTSDPSAAATSVDEFRYIDRNEGIIDIRDDIVDLLILARPMKVICEEKSRCQIPGIASTVMKQEPAESAAETGDEPSVWLQSLEQLKKHYS